MGGGGGGPGPGGRAQGRARGQGWGGRLGQGQGAVAGVGAGARVGGRARVGGSGPGRPGCEQSDKVKNSYAGGNKQYKNASMRTRCCFEPSLMIMLFSQGKLSSLVFVFFFVSSSVNLYKVNSILCPIDALI